MDVMIPLAITAAFVVGAFIGYSAASGQVRRLKARIRVLERSIMAVHDKS